MDKIIEIKGRYSVHQLKQLTPVKGGESKTYKFVHGSPNETIYSGHTEDTNKVFILPVGGPVIIVGEPLKGHVVKAIDYIYNLESYVITFE